MRQVLDSATHVVEKAHYVRIDSDRIRSLAGQIASEKPQIPPWDYFRHYFDGTEKTLFYLLVLDTLNFCFWPKPGRKRWSIEYKTQHLSGYNALAAALKTAFESGLPLDDPRYLASMTVHELLEVLGGEGQLQLMEQRVEAVRELGRYLLDKWNGSPARLVQASKGSAVDLALRVGKELASFRDIALYKGRQVYFYKRAQILVADIYGAFKGRGWGEFHDMARLTAFADYKLPQVLRHLGVLVYRPELAAKVDAKQLIPQGSPEEVEIRAHTIIAVERLCHELEKIGKHIRPFELDWILWNMGQKDQYRKKPYHRTVTIFY